MLRPVVEADAAPTAALVTLDVSDKLLTWPSPMSQQDALERIKATHEALENRTGVDFAILRRTDERLLGWIGLQVLRQREARLGYWLGTQFRGAGLMKEAAREAIAAATKLLGLGSLVATVQKDNHASIAVLDALGFEVSGEEELYFKFKGRTEWCLRYELQVTQTDALSMSEHV